MRRVDDFAAWCELRRENVAAAEGEALERGGGGPACGEVGGGNESSKQASARGEPLAARRYGCRYRWRWLFQLVAQFFERQGEIGHRLPAPGWIFPQALADDACKARVNGGSDIGQRFGVFE